MKLKFYVFNLLIPVILLGQDGEIEPNNTIQEANELSLGDRAILAAQFHSVLDVDYFAVDWLKTNMYYVTSIESDKNVTPYIELYYENNPTNLLSSDISGRNGNRNFRLSGYVPPYNGRYYLKVYDANHSLGAYKIRVAGGRGHSDLIVHEPDNSIGMAAYTNLLNEADTTYGALYPANDIDYYRISANAGARYVIGTMPILDLQPRDTDSYIYLLNNSGSILNENDDLGTVATPSGNVNCTFSQMKGVFPITSTYYIAVRSYYNTNYGQIINESNPPMGEYALYYLADESPSAVAFARYPHVECPTTNSILVQWNTLIAQPTVLRWGETEDCPNTISFPEETNDHLVKISGLAADKKYFYQVLAENDSSAVEYFYPAKPVFNKLVKLFVISDSSPYSGGGSSPEQLAVAAQIMKKDYDFGLHAGDVNQHRGEEYDLVFFEPYKDILKNKTLFTCIGNHDNYQDGAQTYLASFNLPHNNPDSTERYYSFNYGHVHCIALDTNIPYYSGSPQKEWFIQDLQSELRKQTMWTVVFFHHPPWSEGWPDFPGEIEVRNELVPLFEQYKVDIVFNGHTHDYERGLLNGVYYIISGGGGAPLEEGIQAYDYDHVTVWINQHHFTYLRFFDKELEVQAINKDGQIIDLFYAEKETSEVDGKHLAMKEVIPENYQLFQNYPNPFNHSTTIKFAMKHAGSVEVNVFDIHGQLVKNIVAGFANTGIFQVDWDGTNNSGEVVSSGVYFIQLKTANFKQTQSAIFLK